MCAAHAITEMNIVFCAPSLPNAFIATILSTMLQSVFVNAICPTALSECSLYVASVAKKVPSVVHAPKFANMTRKAPTAAL